MSTAINSEKQGKHHHGNLRQALLEAAFQVVRETGRVDSLKVRELARQAGVSTAAPFRHFANRQALISAMSETAAADLRHTFEQTLAGLSGQTPLAQFASLGCAYLRWAAAKPDYFNVLNAPDALQTIGPGNRQRDTEVTYGLMRELLLPAFADQPEQLLLTLLGARALVFGLARLAADGQLKNWAHSPEISLTVQEAVVQLFTQHMADSAGLPGPHPQLPVAQLSSPLQNLP